MSASCCSVQASTRRGAWGRLARIAWMIWIVLTGLLAGPRSANAQRRSAAFALNSLDARAMAMGGALAVLPRDDTALRWNPALLVFMTGPSATASYAQPAAGLSAARASVTAAKPLKEALPALPGDTPLRRMAAGFMLVSSGLDLSEGARWSETQVGAGFACAPATYFTAGATLRLLSNSTEAVDARASGVAVDVGLCALVSPAIEAGLVFHNLVGKVNWSDLGETEGLPLLVDANLALHAHELQGELGFELSSAEATRLQFGAEFLASQGRLPLRAGVRIFFGGEPRFVPSLGFGVSRGRIHADVAASFDRADALGTGAGASVGIRF